MDLMILDICCETGKLDNPGDDFKKGNTDIFIDPKILGDCVSSQKVSLDLDKGNWTVKLRYLDAFTDDWFVSWVKIKTDDPKEIFQCNFMSLIDMGLWDALVAKVGNKKPEAEATCSRINTDSTKSFNSSNAELHENSQGGGNDSFTNKNGIFIALICSAALLLAIGAVVVIWKFCCQKKRDQHQQAKEVDNNPVYGLYYSSSGDRVDEGTTEAVDENNYYGQ